jgi:hypothetical protein
MKRLLTIVALGTALLAGSAIAQSPPATTPPADSAPIAQRSIKITAEQGYVIKENVKAGAATSGQSQAAKIEIGEKAPNGAALQDFPPVVIEKVPAVKNYKFMLSGGEVVVVDPKDNTVADILK